MTASRVASSCSSSAGTRAVDGGHPLMSKGDASSSTVPLGVDTGTNRPRARSCSCSQTPWQVVDPSCGDAPDGQPLAGDVGRDPVETLPDEALQLRDVGDAARIGGEALVGAQFGGEHEGLGHAAPLRIRLDREEDRAAVGEAEGAVGRDRMVTPPRPRGLAGAVHRVVQGRRDPLRERVEHRHLDRSTLAGALSTHERSQDARERVHARTDVRDGEADLAHLLVAGHGEDASLGLDRQVVGLVVRRVGRRARSPRSRPR